MTELMRYKDWHLKTLFLYHLRGSNMLNWLDIPVNFSFHCHSSWCQWVISRSKASKGAHMGSHMQPSPNSLVNLLLSVCVWLLTCPSHVDTVNGCGCVSGLSPLPRPSAGSILREWLLRVNKIAVEYILHLTWG